MKKLLLVLCIVIHGCVAKGQIAAEDITGTLHRVCDRHDSYIMADTAMSETYRKIDLRDTMLLRQIVDEALKGDR